MTTFYENERVIENYNSTAPDSQPLSTIELDTDQTAPSGAAGPYSYNISLRNNFKSSCLTAYQMEQRPPSQKQRILLVALAGVTKAIMQCLGNVVLI